MSTVDMSLVERAYDQTKFFFFSDPKSIFLTTLLFNMSFRWDQKIPTACTTGLELVINPAYFLSLTPDQRKTLIAHEVWHVAFSHMTRLENRNMNCWNRACDYVINYMLVQQGYAALSNWLYDKKYADMSAEQVYEDLIKDPNNSQDFNQSDLGYTNPNSQTTQAQQIANNIVKASTAATMAGQGGHIPSSIVNTIKEYITPPVNWKALFLKYVNMLAKVDYSFKKVNKRFFPNMILPTLAGEKVDQFVVACDSSGSVSDDDLAAFLGQINSARNILKPEKTTLMMFDTAIRDIKEFKNNQQAKYVDFKGRGGTDPECVFEYLHKNKIKPKCLVIFSDMDFEPLDVSFKPKYPVIWVSYKAYRDPIVNFGKLVIMPESK